jgi:hypothetical protein
MIIKKKNGMQVLAIMEIRLKLNGALVKKNPNK